MAPERCQSGFKSGGRGSGSKEFRFFQANFRKILISSGNLKKCSFLGKNCPFTATSELIILFLFKSHHFRTYFLYTIRYNNISRPVHDPSPRPPCNLPRPPAKNLGVATPTLQD